MRVELLLLLLALAAVNVFGEAFDELEADEGGELSLAIDNSAPATLDMEVGLRVFDEDDEVDDDEEEDELFVHVLFVVFEDDVVDEVDDDELFVLGVVV